jgi:dynein heavy chain
MLETAQKLNVKDCCEAKGCLSKLQRLSCDLEYCQKSLNSYLDLKREAFPRFFFTSDDELLSILGSSDLSFVQENMVKVGVAQYFRGNAVTFLSFVKLHFISCCF